MEFQHIFEDEMDTDSTSRVVQTNGGTKISTFSTYSTHTVEKKMDILTKHTGELHLEVSDLLKIKDLILSRTREQIFFVGNKDVVLKNRQN